MGVILVHRVVGMDERRADGVRNPARRGKGAELALRVDNVRAPSDQITDSVIQGRGTQPCARVDQPGIQ